MGSLKWTPFNICYIEPRISGKLWMSIVANRRRSMNKCITDLKVFNGQKIGEVVVWLINFFFIFGVGLWVLRHYWPIVPSPDGRWWWLWRNWWNEDWQGKSKYSEKTCPSATLSTTNPTWLDPGLNPVCRGGKPATNRVSYGAALSLCKSNYCT
jgi:hypothetical protein